MALRWAKHTKRLPSGCLVWTATCDHNGYGKIHIDGKMKKAHRIAWAEVNGPIPAGLVVLHKCDNPPCVELDHLQLGTRKENQQDAVRKGRYARGQWHGSAKLLDSQRAEIARSAAPTNELVARYGVSKSHVKRIRCNARKQACIDA
jgi:hypothetical protein